MMSTNLLRIVVVVVWSYALAPALARGQDPVFSQFYAAPLQLNPALTGSAMAPRIALNYRNQWPSLNNAFITTAASYDQYFDRLNSGFGLSILNDAAGNGIYRTTAVGANYAYQLQIDREAFVRGGFEAAVVNTVLDWNKLLFLDQLDPLTGPTTPTGGTYQTNEMRPDNTSTTYVDFSAGLLAYVRHVYGGVVLRHISAPDASILTRNDAFGTVPVRLTLHAGTEIKLDRRNKIEEAAFISPNILFAKQGQFHQVNIGTYARYKFFSAGAWLRHTFSNADAVILSAGLQYGVLRMAYSYDITVSRLAAYSGGAHEISFLINLEEVEKRNRYKRRYDDCLRIFR